MYDKPKRVQGEGRLDGLPHKNKNSKNRPCAIVNAVVYSDDMYENRRFDNTRNATGKYAKLTETIVSQYVRKTNTDVVYGIRSSYPYAFNDSFASNGCVRCRASEFLQTSNTVP